jgi:WD40 repeat protein
VIVNDGFVSHKIRDAGSGQEILELTSAAEVDLVTQVAFNPEGSRLASVSFDGKVRIWNVTATSPAGRRAPERILDANNSSARDLAWSADGRFVFASGSGGTMHRMSRGRYPHPSRGLPRRLKLRLKLKSKSGIKPARSCLRPQI